MVHLGRATTFPAAGLMFSRYPLGLWFQLASDIRSTAIAPSCQEAGKLAAIVVIRAELDCFLLRATRE